MAGSGCTVSVMYYNISGRFRQTVASFVASAASGGLGVGSLGLQKYTVVNFQPIGSSTTGVATFYVNQSGTTGTSVAPGVLAYSGLTAGDKFIINAFGY